MKLRERALDIAKGAICEDRNKSYGEPEDNFQRIADFWTIYLRGRVESGEEVVKPADVALMLDLLKTARLMNDITHGDGWIDKAGYCGCGYEVTQNGDDSGQG